MVTPITIKDVGDRKLRLADHAVLMAGVNADGEPVPMAAPGTNASGQTVVVEGVNEDMVVATGLQGNVTSSPGQQPVALANFQAQSVEILARRDRITVNSADVYVGFSATIGGNWRAMQPGETWIITAPTGKYIDLMQVYMEVQSVDDGVIFSAVR